MFTTSTIYLRITKFHSSFSLNKSPWCISLFLCIFCS
jgi:hypothetical protein